MDDKFVSIVIPTYNYARYVTMAVDSALSQTHRHREVIVVDDGSTDDTRQRLEPYLNRIRYHYQPNQGLSAARNAGIRAASGGIIALLDSDDLWHPRKLELQMQCLDQAPSCALVGAAALAGAEAGWPEFGQLPAIPARTVTRADLVVKSRFGPSSVVARRCCFTRAGFFDTSLRSVEDRDMWIRIAAHFPICAVDLPLWWYRRHGNNMSSAAERMEDAERRVVHRALAALARERPVFLLRRKALAYALRSAAYRYDTAGMHGTALARLIRSMSLWPWPFRKDEALTFFERPKMFLLFFIRMLRSLQKDSRRSRRENS